MSDKIEPRDKIEPQRVDSSLVSGDEVYLREKGTQLWEIAEFVSWTFKLARPAVRVRSRVRVRLADSSIHERLETIERLLIEEEWEIVLRIQTLLGYGERE